MPATPPAFPPRFARTAGFKGYRWPGPRSKLAPSSKPGTTTTLAAMSRSTSTAPLRALVCAGAVVCLVTVSGCGSGKEAGPTASSDPSAANVVPLPGKFPPVSDRGVYGVAVQVAFSFPDDRTIISGSYQVAGRTETPLFYPAGWGDDDVPPAHPSVRAGQRVVADATVKPSCETNADDAAALLVSSRSSDGEIHKDRLPIGKGDDAALIRDIAASFCAKSVQADIGDASRSRNGQNVTVTYTLVNPGPESVSVSSAAWKSGNSRWLPASTSVPADGKPHPLTVEGFGVGCHSQGGNGPLAMGLVTASGSDPHIGTKDATMTKLC
jgi:hypothetical protein